MPNKCDTNYSHHEEIFFLLDVSIFSFVEVYHATNRPGTVSWRPSVCFGFPYDPVDHIDSKDP